MFSKEQVESGLNSRFKRALPPIAVWDGPGMAQLQLMKRVLGIEKRFAGLPGEQWLGGAVPTCEEPRRWSWAPWRDSS